MVKKSLPKRVTERDFVKMAKAYAVDKNPLFLSALEAYTTQRETMDELRRCIGQDTPTVEKEYVKGRANVCIHPAVKELPRHAEAMNKTATVILNIIKELGKAPRGPVDEFTSY